MTIYVMDEDFISDGPPPLTDAEIAHFNGLLAEEAEKFGADFGIEMSPDAGWIGRFSGYERLIGGMVPDEVADVLDAALDRFWPWYHEQDHGEEEGGG